MATTYSQNTGLQLLGDGERSGLWGGDTNLNMQILDRLLNGVGAITLAGTTHSLTTSDGALSDGQYRVVVFGGSPSGTNTVTLAPNDQQKLYFVVNSSGEQITLTQGSGGNVDLADGGAAIIYADGAGAGAEVVDLTSLFSVAGSTVTLAGTQTLTNKTVTGLTLDGALTEEVHVLTGTSVALDPANGTIQTHSLTGNTTYTDSLASGQSITLMIDDGSGYSVTWPTTTHLTTGGAAPTLATSGYNVVVLFKVASVLYLAVVKDGAA